MIGSRNLTVHTYNEDTANAIVDSVLNSYFPLFQQLEKDMLEREAQEP